MVSTCPTAAREVLPVEGPQRLRSPSLSAARTMGTLLRPRPEAGTARNPTASPPGEAGALARAGLQDAEDVLADLGTADEGLSTSAAEARLSRQGPNPPAPASGAHVSSTAERPLPSGPWGAVRWARKPVGARGQAG